jgi:hypothetical protein
VDRSPDRDDVGERREDVVLGHQVVLRRALRDKEFEHVRLTRAHEGVLAYRHASVRRDDGRVQCESEQHERHPRELEVESGEREEERVGARQHRDAHREIRAGAPIGQRYELEREPGDHESPPAQPQLFEASEPSSEGEADEHCNDDGGEEEDHLRRLDAPTAGHASPAGRG